MKRLTCALASIEGISFFCFMLLGAQRYFMLTWGPPQASGFLAIASAVLLLIVALDFWLLCKGWLIVAVALALVLFLFALAGAFYTFGPVSSDAVLVHRH